MENAPTTFAELMKGRRWTIIRQLFKRNNVSLKLSTSEEMMGEYSQVILDGDGFKIKTDRAGLQAAFTQSRSSFRSITKPEEVFEAVLGYDGSLTETGVVATIIKKVDELLLIKA